MTRTARRSSGKQALAATPWSLLRTRRAYKRHRDLLDEGMSTGEEIEEQTAEESSASGGEGKRAKKGQLKVTRKAKLAGNIVKKFFSKLKARLTSKRVRKKVDGLTPLLQEDESSEEASGKKKCWKGKLRRSMRRAPAGDARRLLLTEEEEEEMEGEDSLGSVSDRKKVKQKEARRLRRQKHKVCFGCRQNGHLVSECPSASETGICFKCGSAEHSVSTCKATAPEGYFPYAKCFICGEVGHLSRACPDNPRGLYPKGGGCRVCGSVEHLKAACPERIREEVESEGFVRSNYSSAVFKNTSADADEVMDTTAPNTSTRRTGNALKKDRFVAF